MTRQVIAKLRPMIQAKEVDGSIPTLTFEQLYEPLDNDERAFVRQFEKLKGRKIGIKIPWRGLSSGAKLLVAVRNQKIKEKVKITENGVAREEIRERTLPKQFLPLDVFQQYTAMMEAMEKDIGKRLWIESGYRSSALQLYLFIYYLQNHNYSIKETVKFVTLPGYSEHGDPKHQAVDFINEEGINGDPNVKEFELLPENLWLLTNASRFGFLLSYPKDGKKGITYEPWHWRYDPKAARKQAKKLSKKQKKSSVSNTSKSSGNPNEQRR